MNEQANTVLMNAPFGGIDKMKGVYFIGIGGIGMSAIARFFYSRRVKVSGYDKTATVLTLKSLAMLPIETPQYPYRTMAKNFSAGLTPLTFVAVN